MNAADLAGAALLAWLFAAGVMSVAWLVQRRTGNAGIVDPVWAACVGAIALGLAGFVDAPLWRRAAVAGLAGLWSLRLAGHLVRRVAGSREDPRYAALRRAWGDAAQGRMFLFYQAQALSCAILALPFAAALAAPATDPGFGAAAGLVIGLGAITGEAVADHQLAQFRAKPAARDAICDTGLWGWSRHPNYFFEWLFWWAFVALAWGSPLVWLALAGPVAMGHFLLNVTGIPATERHMLETRGAAFRAYQRRVSAFVPWPPARRPASGPGAGLPGAG